MAEVLIVDDSKVMREMISACLRLDVRLRLSNAASGLEAIELLCLKSFDVLVLDLNMPDISGLEVIEFVRSQKNLAALPILVVTTPAHADNDDAHAHDDDAHARAEILAAGASDYMTKPFAPEVILGAVQSLLLETSSASASCASSSASTCLSSPPGRTSSSEAG